MDGFSARAGKTKQGLQEVKMLLLGAGDSGKTTILKQLKLNFEGGYNDRERKLHRNDIFSITVASMRSVLLAMPQLNVPIQPGNESRKELILGLNPNLTINQDYLPREISEALRGLWYDPGFLTAGRAEEQVGRGALIDERGTPELGGVTKGFFHALERMSTPGYLPTDQDILRSRVKTTGIVENVFKVGETHYRVFDVGGQRSERKKWINCFDGVNALVFMVSLSDDHGLGARDSVDGEP
ncbi:guanine nucleotide-binding protein subunit alpha [Tulasnella sp. 427]|nr:guanine nucleotide-binding protein subunit alpha [Tulasnella sp. 427]